MRRNLIAAYSGMFLNMLHAADRRPSCSGRSAPEASGLIGIGLMLQSILTFLEAGLSASLSRAFAEKDGQEAAITRACTIFWRARVFLCGLVCLVCLLVTLLAPLLARHWITGHALPHDMVWQSIALIGLMIAMRFFRFPLRRRAAGGTAAPGRSECRFDDDERGRERWRVAVLLGYRPTRAPISPGWPSAAR